MVASVFWSVAKALSCFYAVVTVFCVVAKVLLVCFGRLSRHYYVAHIATILCFVHCCAVDQMFWLVAKALPCYYAVVKVFCVVATLFWVLPKIFIFIHINMT